jgi:hypothetical protein
MSGFDKYCPECPQVASINNTEMGIHDSGSVGILHKCHLGKIKAGSGSTVDNKLPIEDRLKLRLTHH